MLNEYKAILDNGQLTWIDPMPNVQKTEVRVILLSNAEIDDNPNQYQKSRRIGMSAGKAKFPDDINKYDDEVARLFGVER